VLARPKENMRKNDMRVYSPEKAREMILDGIVHDYMEVDGSIHLSNSKELTELPKGLHVYGDLYLDGCTALTELPKDLEVGRWLNLEGCTALKVDC
jgi:hypothetical protein